MSNTVLWDGHSLDHAVLLSIRTHFVRKILDGSKNYELRRRIFSEPVGRSILVYSSGEDKAVTVRGVVADVIEGTPDTVWRKLGNQLGLNREEYFEYFGGSDIAYALELSQISALTDPVSLIEMRVCGLEPPQSWRYIRKDDHAEFFERLLPRCCGS